MSDINYNKFKQSLACLETRYKQYKESQGLEAYLVEALQESCIKLFEVCFATSWKHLKKYLYNEGMINISDSPVGIIKHAGATKVIEDVELWLEFNREWVSISSDYNGDNIDQTLGIIEDFIIEARDLYETISGEEWQA